MLNITTKGTHTNIKFLLIIGALALTSGIIITVQSGQAVSEAKVYDLTDRQTLPAQRSESRQPTRNTLIEPIAELNERITKKPFGIYITPETSPVQPERFSGFHTGIDVEYDDITDDISVKAIADGEVIASQVVSGYGGIVAIQHIINDESVIGLYGHLNNATTPKSGTLVIGGQIIGSLGADLSPETDGERKHLHFGLIKGTSVNYKGYVDTIEELDSWYNPLEFYD